MIQINDKMALKWLIPLFIILNIVYLSIGAPVGPGGDGKRSKGGNEKHRVKNDGIVGLDEEEYKRYVEELRQLNQKTFDQMQERYEKAKEVWNTVDKKLAPESEDVRSRLDEAKRSIIDQLRGLARVKQLRMEGIPISPMELKALGLESLPKDISDKDIEKMMHEKLEVLQALDSKRKEMFKEHEMGVELQRRDKLKKMNERERIKAEEEYQKEMEERRKQKMPHPASKEQLEDVWENQDEMEKEDFEPKSFFLMHDTNQDKFLDPLELEAMFYKEVKDIYGEGRDQSEIHEEMSRMREHVMQEIDTNQDGMISYKEFLKYTEGSNYDDEEWKDIDQEDLYNDEELDEFAKHFNGDYYDYYDDDEVDEINTHPSIAPAGKGLIGDDAELGNHPVINEQDHSSPPEERRQEQPEQPSQPENHNPPEEHRQEQPEQPSQPESHNPPEVEKPNEVHQEQTVGNTEHETKEEQNQEKENTKPEDGNPTET